MLNRLLLLLAEIDPLGLAGPGLVLLLGLLALVYLGLPGQLGFSRGRFIAVVLVLLAYPFFFSLPYGGPWPTLGPLLLLVEILVVLAARPAWRSALATLALAGLAFILLCPALTRIDSLPAAVITFIGGSLLLALFVVGPAGAAWWRWLATWPAGLAQTEFWRGRWQRLRTGPGGLAGVSLRLILWSLLALTYVELLVAHADYAGDLLNRTGSGGDAPFPYVSVKLPYITLPAALLAAGLVRLIERPGLAGRARLSALGMLVFVAGAVYGLPSYLFFLPRLLGLPVPEMASRLVAAAWPALALVAIWSIVPRRYGLAWAWRAVGAGALTGLGLVLALAYPVSVLVYVLFVPGSAYTGPALLVMAILNLAPGLLLALVAGPLAVWWSRPADRVGRLVAGLLAGLVAGLLLFVGLGAPVAGLVVYAPLYGIALDRTGYSQGELVLKAVRATNLYFPLIYGLFWLHLASGAVIGGLTGLRLTLGPTADLARRPPPPRLLWPLAAAVVSLGLGLIILLHLSLLAQLNEAIQVLFDEYGFNPAWLPHWTTILQGVLPWLALVILQAATLAGLRRLPPGPDSRLLARLGIAYGLLCLLILPLLLSPLDQASPVRHLWALGPMLVVVLLGLELLVVSWRRLDRLLASQSRGRPSFGLLAWPIAGLVGGSLTAAMLQATAAATLSPLLVGLSMVAESSSYTAPPPGPAWLEQIFAPLLATHVSLFVTLWLWLGLAGVAGAACAGLAYGLWRRVGSPAVKEARIGLASLRRFGWLAAALLLGVALLFFLPAAAPGPFLLAAALVLFLPHIRPVWTLVLLLVGLGLVAALGYSIGGLSLLAASLAFGTGLALTRRSLVERAASPEQGRVVSSLGWAAAIAAVVYQVGSASLALVILALAVGWFIARPGFFRRLSWPGLALVFGLALAGLLGLALDGPYRLWLTDWQMWHVYLPLAALVAVIAYRALLRYASPAVRTFTLAAAALLLGWVGYSSQVDLVHLGGLSRYDSAGGQWQIYTPANSGLAGPLNYHFLVSRSGTLWLAGGPRLAIALNPPNWQPYLGQLPSIWKTSTRLWAEVSSSPMTLLEDEAGQFWFGSPVGFGRFSPDKMETYFEALIEFETPDRFSDPAAGTACVAGAARLWDSEGNFITTLVTHPAGINIAAFSPDGARILTAGPEMAALLDPSGRSIASLDNYGAAFSSVDFSLTGSRLLTTRPDLALLWDSAGQIIWSFETPGIISASLSPAGDTLLVLTPAATWLWGAGDSFPLQLSHDPTTASAKPLLELTSARFSPNGKWVLTAGRDGTARLWTRDGKPIVTYSGHTGLVNMASFSSSGTRLVTAGDDGTARLWTLDGRLVAVLDGHDAGLTWAGFSPDGNRVATASRDGRVRLWDAGGRALAVLPGPPGPLSSVKFSPDGARLLMVSQAGAARLWDVSGRLLVTLPGDRVTSAGFSPDGSRLVTAECLSGDSYRLAIGQPVTTRLHSPLGQMALDRDGRVWLATARNGLLRLAGGKLGQETWEFYTVQNRALPSDEVRLVYADRSGNTWAGTATGLSRFDGEVWSIIRLPEPLDRTPVTALLEDSRGWLWLGTERGGARNQSQDWVSFERDDGWPDGLGVDLLFEDSRGHIWAGTAAGPFHFDGRQWHNLFPGTAITSFAEGPPGVIWIGSRQGLLRYPWETNRRTRFDFGTGGLGTNWVRDLHVDDEGRVWVVTFATESARRSPWWAVGAGILVFSYTCARVYRALRNNV